MGLGSHAIPNAWVCFKKKNHSCLFYNIHIICWNTKYSKEFCLFFLTRTSCGFTFIVQIVRLGSTRSMVGPGAHLCLRAELIFWITVPHICKGSTSLWDTGVWFPTSGELTSEMFYSWRRARKLPPYLSACQSI